MLFKRDDPHAGFLTMPARLLHRSSEQGKRIQERGVTPRAGDSGRTYIGDIDL
jgi:hypothetical protein